MCIGWHVVEVAQCISATYSIVIIRRFTLHAKSCPLEKYVQNCVKNRVMQMLLITYSESRSFSHAPELHSWSVESQTVLPAALSNKKNVGDMPELNKGYRRYLLF